MLFTGFTLISGYKILFPFHPRPQCTHTYVITHSFPIPFLAENDIVYYIHNTPFIPHSIPPRRDGDKLVPSVQKKINELEVGLLHLQQNIDIPEISLPIHPAIVATVKKAVEAGTKPSVEDLGASVMDSSFLNALQKDVSRWIREIQKVHV